jgi:hypothetical protein
MRLGCRGACVTSMRCRGRLVMRGMCRFSCRVGRRIPAFRNRHLNRRLGATAGGCRCTAHGGRSAHPPVMRWSSSRSGRSGGARSRCGVRCTLGRCANGCGATCRRPCDIGLSALRPEALLKLYGRRGSARRGGGMHRGNRPPGRGRAALRGVFYRHVLMSPLAAKPPHSCTSYAK